MSIHITNQSNLILLNPNPKLVQGTNEISKGYVKFLKDSAFWNLVHKKENNGYI